MAEPTAVVTGASSGIGLYTALGLARAGMRVVMVGRELILTLGGGAPAERDDVHSKPYYSSSAHERP